MNVPDRLITVPVRQMNRLEVWFMQMTKSRTHSLLLLLTVVLVVLPARGQDRDEGTVQNNVEDAGSHMGYPQDWSSRHLVVTGESAKDPLASGSREPRHVYNRVIRENAIRESRRHPKRPRHTIKVDWSVSLEKWIRTRQRVPREIPV
jgi:hypothetical protein